MARSLRLPRVVATTTALGLLVACGGSAGSSDEAELTWFMWSGSQEEVQTWEHLADMVTQQYPGITVTFETASFDDYFTKLTARAASDSLPCLVSVQAQRVADVGQLFLPLDSYMDADEDFDISAFDSSIVDALTLDDEQRAIPYDLGPYVVYYNATMFEQADLDLPEPGWTEHEFLTAARETTAGDTYGYVTDAYPDRWLPFAVTRGAEYLEGDELDLTNPELSETLDWFAGLVSDEQISAPVPATSSGTWALDEWRAGNAAMVVNGPWDLINTKENVDFEFGIAPIPATNGQSVSLTTGSGFGIAESCENPEAAWNAIEVLTSDQAQQYLGENGRALPARTNQQTHWYDHAVPGADETLEATLETAIPFRTARQWDQASNLMRQHGVQALDGSMSAAEVLETVQAQVGQ